MTKIRAAYPYLIYQKDVYKVVSYTTLEKVINPDGDCVDKITCVGECDLPIYDELTYVFEGEWTREKKRNTWSFKVQSYTTEVASNKEGIISYLKCGIIKGIREKTAEKIYEAFGDQTIEIMDNDIGRLIEVKGISKITLEKIETSYMETRSAQKVIQKLTEYKIDHKRILQIFKKCGVAIIDDVDKNPYVLVKYSGVSFANVDKIALAKGSKKDSPYRICAGILECLQLAQYGCNGRDKLFNVSGHTSLPKEVLVIKTTELLGYDKKYMPYVEQMLNAMLKSGKTLAGFVDKADRKVYVGKAYVSLSEVQIATNIKRLLKGNILASQQHLSIEMINKEIRLEEDRTRLPLAKEQKEAVVTALSNWVSIVTGGPGTGKTMIQKMVIAMIRKFYPQANIVCCAPTGRAATRMTESTGYPSMTIHKTFNIRVSEDDREIQEDVEQIEGDFFIIDEMSMLDTFVAASVFAAIKTGARVLIVGDIDQLPSVMAGAVLKDMIDSKVIPTVRLVNVYRQASTSKIAINAALIRQGKINLEYDSDFQFIEATSFTDAQEKLIQNYLPEVAAHGLDNVVILTPYRLSSETGANTMNPILQEKVNPDDPSKNQKAYKNKLFREGDKIMQTKNTECVSNGDIGYIKEIWTDSDQSTIISNDFGRSRTYDYAIEEMDDVELAYCTTIHKSQGSEYKTVLINIMDGHGKMRKRNLIYTALTRAKTRVIIVGQRTALIKSILDADTSKRSTLLSMLLNDKLALVDRIKMAV